MFPPSEKRECAGLTTSFPYNLHSLVTVSCRIHHGKRLIGGAGHTPGRTLPAPVGITLETQKLSRATPAESRSRPEPIKIGLIGVRPDELR